MLLADRLIHLRTTATHPVTKLILPSWKTSQYPDKSIHNRYVVSGGGDGFGGGDYSDDNDNDNNHNNNAIYLYTN